MEPKNIIVTEVIPAIVNVEPLRRQELPYDRKQYLFNYWVLERFYQTSSIQVARGLYPTVEVKAKSSVVWQLPVGLSPNSAAKYKGETYFGDYTKRQLERGEFNLPYHLTFASDAESPVVLLDKEAFNRYFIKCGDFSWTERNNQFYVFIYIAANCIKYGGRFSKLEHEMAKELKLSLSIVQDTLMVLRERGLVAVASKSYWGGIKCGLNRSRTYEVNKNVVINQFTIDKPRG